MKNLVILEGALNPIVNPDIKNIVEDVVTNYRNSHPGDNVQIERIVFSEYPQANNDIIKLGIKAKITPFLLKSHEKELLAKVEHLKNVLFNSDTIIVVNPVWDDEVVHKIEGWRNFLNNLGNKLSFDKSQVDDVVGNRKMLLIQMVDSGHNYAQHYVKEIMTLTGFTDFKVIKVSEPYTDYYNEINKYINSL